MNVLVKSYAAIIRAWETNEGNVIVKFTSKPEASVIYIIAGLNFKGLFGDIRFVQVMIPNLGVKG